MIMVIESGLNDQNKLNQYWHKKWDKNVVFQKCIKINIVLSFFNYYCHCELPNLFTCLREWLYTNLKMFSEFNM